MEENRHKKTAPGGAVGIVSLEGLDQAQPFWLWDST